MRKRESKKQGISGHTQNKKKNKESVYPPTDTGKKYFPPAGIVDDSNTFNLLENVFLQGYEEYISAYKKYSPKTCSEYFKLKVDGCLNAIERKIDSHPANLKEQACEVLFSAVKYQVEIFRVSGNKFQSPKSIASKKNYHINLKDYEKFIQQQERAFELLLLLAPERKEAFKFNMSLDLFNAQLGNSRADTKAVPPLWSNSNEIEMRVLYDYLVIEEFISSIDFSAFKNHCLGISESRFINWITQSYKLPAFLNLLSDCFDKSCYRNGKQFRPSVAVKHFHFMGSIIKTASFSNWRKQFPDSASENNFTIKIKPLLKKLNPTTFNL